ncbi:hypothetical protein D3C81_2309850 [compost metagenome]
MLKVSQANPYHFTGGHGFIRLLTKLSQIHAGALLLSGQRFTLLIKNLALASQLFLGYAFSEGY